MAKVSQLKNSKARYIKHESIRMGDIIKISGHYVDMDITRQGTVRKRLHNGREVEYLTAQGAVLLTVYGDGTSDAGRYTVTLLRRELDSKPFDDKDPEPTLWDGI